MTGREYILFIPEAFISLLVFFLILWLLSHFFASASLSRYLPLYLHAEGASQPASQ